MIYQSDSSFQPVVVQREAAMIVDVHTHYFPERYLDLVEKEGSRYGVELTRNDQGERELRIQGLLHPPLRAFFDVDLRLREMEAMGVDVHVVHHSSRPNVLFAEAGLAAELCRESNDAYADLLKTHPGKFVGLGVLPLQDPAAAVRELERMRDLGLSGVMLPSNVEGEYLASKTFYPLYEALDVFRMAVFVHPIAPAGVEKMREFRMWNGVGFPLETTLTIGKLLFSGTLEKFPAICWIFAHGGGTVPYLQGRWGQIYEISEENRRNVSGPPAEALRSLWFDSLVYHSPAISYLVQEMGADRVVLGSDYPYDMTPPDPVGDVRRADLGDSAEALVLGGNAERLFKEQVGGPVHENA